MNRRRFLQAAAAGGLALPLLPSIAHDASAQGSGAPLRFVVFFYELGAFLDEWSPTGSETSMDLDAGLPAGTSVLSPLSAVQDDLVVVSGLNNPLHDITDGAGHDRKKSLLTNMPSTFGTFPNGAPGDVNGWAAGPSIDRVIMQRMGPVTPLTALDVIVGESDPSTTTVISYEGADAPVQSRYVDPAQLFDSIFASFTPPGGMPAMPSEEERRNTRRRRLLDTVGETFSHYRKRLGTDDRARLDQHAAALADLRDRIGVTSMPAAGCVKPQPPGATNIWDIDATADLFTDQVAMALACDLTRVATINLSTTGHSDWGFTGGTTYADWHTFVHDNFDNPAERPTIRNVMRWHMEKLSRFLQTLKAMPEGDGSVLDNTVVLAVSDLGNAGAHSAYQLPVLVAGGAAGQLTTGRHLQRPGLPLSDLLVSLLRLFGHDDVTFGDAAFCNGPLNGFVG